MIPLKTDDLYYRGEYEPPFPTKLTYILRPIFVSMICAV